MMVEKAPKREVWDETPYSACTTSKGPPVVDTVFATLTGISFLFVNVASVVFFVPWSISAYHGHTETTACEEYGLYRLAKKGKEQPAAPAALVAPVAAPAATPAAGVLEKAKRCQEKGGVWVNDTCQISVSDP
jgi:hypothetical protein